MSFSSSKLTRRLAIKRAVMALGWAMAASRHIAAQAPSPEYAAKASSLTLFPEYIKWPAGSSFSAIGIVGEDPFSGALDKLNPKRAKSVEELKDCQIIFVPKTESENVDAILNGVGTASILTVGETDGFAKRGGMIGFVMDDGKVRFEINTAAARRAGLGIDLRLLKLALHVVNS